MMRGYTPIEYEWLTRDGLLTATVALEGGDEAQILAASADAAVEAWRTLSRRAGSLIPALAEQVAGALDADADPVAMVRGVADALGGLVETISGGPLLDEIADDLAVFLIRFTRSWTLGFAADVYGWAGDLPQPADLAGNHEARSEAILRLPAPYLHRLIRGILALSGNC